MLLIKSNLLSPISQIHNCFYYQFIQQFFIKLKRQFLNN